MLNLSRVFAFVAIFATFAAAVSDEEPAVHRGIIDHVNRKYSAGLTTWKADYNLKFAEATIKDAKRLLGTKMEGQEVTNAFNRIPKLQETPVKDLPTNFDSRQKWADCSQVIGNIRDQADCGSCWAFGSTEAFNDRKCISSGGKVTIPFSTQQTTSCCNMFGGCFGSSGCNGGIPAEAWGYFVNTGVVSGGDYQDNGKGDTCYPYQLPKCNHHVNGPYPNCTSEGPTPSCPNPKACTNTGYPTSWDDDKHYATKSYGFNSVTDIQTNMFKNGPVTASFTVYQDFLAYKSGVYQHESGPALGGHAIKVLGWGEENGTPYWLVANSWNEYWGDHGYFKILRGQNECGIESQMVAGDA